MPAPRKKAPIENISILHEQCWAKTLPDGSPGISVKNHCLNVGCVAEALVALLLPSLQACLPDGVATLAALHDLGKVSPGFQQKCAKWLRQHGLADVACAHGWQFRVTDHAVVSRATVQVILNNAKLSDWAAILGAHHGCVKAEGQQVSEVWEEERCRLAEELKTSFGPLPTDEPAPEILWLVAGLIAVADWIGSDERQFPQFEEEDMPARRSRSRQALKRLGWKRLRIRRALDFGDLFSGLSPNDLQAAAISAIREPGVYVIEGPMGSGKTEAALAAAYGLLASGKATGLYFSLPTQVTSNRIHLRVQPFVQRIADQAPEVQLAHSASWLAEQTPPPELRPASSDPDSEDHVRAGRSWFASPKRALLAPFGVGTIDQALLAIVAANHFFVRQFGLAGKVVILDEVHSYDLYTGTLVDSLIQQLRGLGCTVIVLSATLTAARRRQLLTSVDDVPLSQAYPLVSAAGPSVTEIASEPPARIEIAVRWVEAAALVEDALERASRGHCVLWIRNTVDDAQETYRCIMAAKREGGPPIALLHSRFPFFRREELEERWITALGKDAATRPNGCVLISTQVAEQSVDIDADLLITDLAPSDMLLQRLGRVWRHNQVERSCDYPEVWIQQVPVNDEMLAQATAKELCEVLGKNGRVYVPYLLLRSLQQWRGRKVINLPTDIRSILEATYADSNSDEPTAWQELKDVMEMQRRTLSAQALSATQVWAMPALKDDEGVQTRYTTYPTAQLLLATEVTSLDGYSAQLCLLDGSAITAHTRNWNFETAKAIHRNLVRVPFWAVADAFSSRPGWLNNYATKRTVAGILQRDGSIRWPDDERPSALSYHADQGVIIHREHIKRARQEVWDESYD